MEDPNEQGTNENNTFENAQEEDISESPPETNVEETDVNNDNVTNTDTQVEANTGSLTDMNDSETKSEQTGYTATWKQGSLGQEKDLRANILERMKSMENKSQDEMWQTFFESRKNAETDNRVQEIDGNFFERFGSRLKENQENQKVKDEKDGILEDMMVQSNVEPLQAASPKEMITTVIGWNIDELYSEILYEVLHIVGTDVAAQQVQLLEYLQEVFKLDSEKHNALLEQVKTKEAPNILLNVEVIEGKELSPKDANGLSDPFCTLFMSSSTVHRYNTSVKSQTLSPRWEEYFSLPVQNVKEDTLHLEVWDFDPAETVREKVSRISEVKGVKGLRKFVKEIAVTASTGKHDNELIGIVDFPIKDIPSNGQTIWCSIHKKPKAKRQGVLRIKMTFGSEKNCQVATQEYKHLVRNLLLYHLEKEKIEPYYWKGEFDILAQTLIRQHVAQSNLSPTDQSLAEFAEFVAVHLDHPLSFTVFSNLLDHLIDIYPSFNEYQVKSFWDSAKKLLPSCFSNLRKLRKSIPNDEHTLTQLSALLSILSSLSQKPIPAEVDLLPDNIYGWIVTPGQNDLHITLKDAVSQGAIDWIDCIIDQNKPESNEDEAVLVNRIKIVQLVRTDLQKAIDHHDEIFKQIMQFPYAATLFEVYYPGLVELCQPLVERMSSKLETIRIPFIDTNEENQTNSYGDYSTAISTGTSLLELYLSLRNFFELGQCNKQIEFYDWFSRVVVNWLDIARYKALQRIDKAIELDTLTPVDSSVKYSSSAVDTLAIFYQIKIFWEQLAWPDVEGCFTFVAKIIDDMCRSCNHYADKMSKKVDYVQSTSMSNVFQVTPEWCYAMNNIDYVRHSIEPLVQELGVAKIVQKLAEFRSDTASQHCEQTLKGVVANANDTVSNKLIDLILNAINKMLPVIEKLLLEGIEFEIDSKSLDKLMTYLDNSLVTMRNQLNPDNFQRVLGIIWNSVSFKVENITLSSLNQKKPPQFFKHLLKIFDVLIEFFNESNDEAQEFRKSLELYSLSTDELTHRYHLQQCQKIQSNGDSGGDCGQLTIRAMILKNQGLLKIEIMNCRSLKPVDSDGNCDPYVKINFLPEDKFLNATKPRTKVQKKTLYPLFDETFQIVLTNDQMDLKDALIQFVIKDQDFLGKNAFIGESFLFMNRIKIAKDSEKLMDMEQIHMKLAKPGSGNDSKIWDVIEQRSLSLNDKKAKEFIKRQKTRMG
uniref:BAI1-associated protein 3 n=1 Tax=Cacopsylla melanoneura TaxID=428564 RepID=A0A8D8U3A5_9HEMI